MTTRLSININDATAQVLREFADAQQTTVTEQVRRAVSVYDFFDKALEDGNRIETVEPCTCRRGCRQKLITIVVLP